MRELERDSFRHRPACKRAGGRRARAGWAPRSRRRCVPRATRSIGPLGRGADGAGADAVLLCVPDAEIAAAAALIAPGRWSATARAPPGSTRSRPRGVLAASADDRDRAPARSSPAPARRSPAARRARSSSRRRSPSALGMRAGRVADGDRAAYHAAASIASNFLVTLEAAAERLAATRRRRPRRCSSPLVRATVENWARARRRARADRARSRAGDEATVARAARRRSPSARPSCWRCSTRSSTRPGRSPTHRDAGGGGRDEDARAPSPSCAPRSPRRAAPGATIGLVPTMGALPRRPPVADARARARDCDVVVDVAVRQPDPVQRRRATSPPIRATSSATPSSPPSAGVDFLFAPPRRGDLPGRVRHHRLGRRADRDARGRAARPRPLRRRRHGRHEAVQHGRAGRRLLRPEGRAAGGGDQAARRATSTSRCGSRSARPCASPTGSRCRAATSACRRRTANARRALTARCEPPRTPSTRASATRAAIAGARRGPNSLQPRSSPSTSSSSTPTRWRPCRRSTATCSPSSPRGSATTRLIDNQPLSTVASDGGKHALINGRT